MSESAGQAEGLRIARNSALLGAGDVAGLTLGFFTNFLVIDRLGEAYGLLIGAQRFVAFFLVLAQFGLHPFLVRWIAAGRGEPGALLGSVLALRGGLAFVFVGAVVAGAEIGAYMPGHRSLLLVFVAIELLGVAVESWLAVCEGLERMGRAAVAAFVRSLSTFVGVVAVVSAGGGLAEILAVYTASRAIQLVTIVALVRGALPALSLGLDWGRFRPMLREALLFVAIGFAFQGLRSVDVVMLARFAGEAETARYGAALIFLEYLFMLPAFVQRALLPAFSRLEAEGGAARMVSNTLQIFSLVALPAAIGLSLLAEQAVALYPSGDFPHAAPVLRVLGLAVLAAGPVTVIAAYLTGAGRLAALIACYAVTLPFQVGINWMLIPEHGALGVAVGTTTAFALLAGSLMVAGLALGLSFPWAALGRQALASGVLAAVVWGTRDLFLVIPVAAGGLAYVAVLAAILPADALERRVLRDLRTRWGRD